MVWSCWYTCSYSRYPKHGGYCIDPFEERLNTHISLPSSLKRWWDKDLFIDKANVEFFLLGTCEKPPLQPRPWSFLEPPYTSCLEQNEHECQGELLPSN
jgi:hypothetical protein